MTENTASTMSSNGAANGAAAEPPKRFGAFGGVFTPSILTILGVILFMRAGFVIGQAGIVQALIMLAIAKAISMLTAFSISAIATNTEVKGGGAYFLISRTLGPEFGATIGLALYCAQALSVPFYVLGFTEALLSAVPLLLPYAPYVALVTLFVLFGVTYVGAGWAIKAQYGIMTILGLSIAAFLGGAALRFDQGVLASNWSSGYTPNVGFWVVFAIYFPAVTGIMAGVNMSGDLKKPARALPLGTFAAVLVGLLIYAAQIVLCGGAVAREQLAADPFGTLVSMATLHLGPITLPLGFLVVCGVFAATLSSALGSFLGAPRIIQALAQDDILRVIRPFAKLSPKGEPHRALYLTLVLSFLVLYLSAGVDGAEAFNMIATFVAMLFLCTYGITNLAAFVESFGRNPSFRPRFKLFHWSLALAGAAGCVLAASLISPGIALIAIAAVALMFYIVRKFVMKTSFGDARRGFVYARIRDNLFRLAELPVHPKNWRPTSLVLTGNPNSRLTLVRYAIWTSSGRGIVTLVAFLIGDLIEKFEERNRLLKALGEFIEENSLAAFPQVIVSPDFDWGLNQLLQYGGSIGPVRPNMMVVGFPTDPGRATRFARHLATADRLGMSLLVIHDAGLPLLRTRKNKRIDVWWRGMENGSLMLILAYLLTLNQEWSGASIRVLRVVGDEQGRAEAVGELAALIDAARMDVRAEVIVSHNPLRDTLYEYSHESTVVFLGFGLPAVEGAEQFQASFARLLEGLPTTLLVHSTGEADLTS